MSSDAETVRGCQIVQHPNYDAIFSSMTAKQEEVFSLLAENHTGKEIAFRLQISESAVVKRIEVIRARTGFPVRAELVRHYRAYLKTCQADQANDTQEGVGSPEQTVTVLQEEDLFIPPMLAAQSGGLNRIAAMVVIAAGLLVIALASLMTAQVLSNLRQASQVWPHDRLYAASEHAG